MIRLNKASRRLVLVVSVLASVCLAKPVLAGTPYVTNVVVFDTGGDTILNVTVNHVGPLSTSHYVDKVEVNVGGTLHLFNYTSQASENFTVSCDIGQVAGTPTATVQAHCIIHLYGPSYGPVQVPEFSLPRLLLTLTLIASLAVLVFRKIKTKH